MKLATLAGIALVAAHAAGFAYLAQHSAGEELTLAAPPLVVATGEQPGLHRERRSVTYRGGHVREVGATQLVGPFQDPAAPACSGRLVVGQAMLDAIAPVMKDTLTKQLNGMDVFPVGAFGAIDTLALAWARLDSTPGDRALVGDAPDGYVRVTGRVRFDRGDVALIVALIPQRAAHELKFRIAALADLSFHNALFRWISDKLGADRIATSIAREEIDDILVTTFAPPPPFDVGNGQTLQFTYCDAPLEIVDRAYGALPFAVVFTPLPNAPEILPPRFGPGTRAKPSADTQLALDLDVDALNALLFELWHTGYLDRQLADVGLDRRFNADPTVTDYLSIRLSPVRLALPPVISPSGGALQLAADARVAIADGTRVTTGRVYGALDFHFLPATSAELPVAVDLGDLELSCERSPTTLVPCYGDLVAAVRGRGAELHGVLTDAFAALLDDIFVDRHIQGPSLPAELVIESVVPSITQSGTVHLELGGKLVPTE